LDRKFKCIKYDSDFIFKCLHKDILDFQFYNKEIIKSHKLYLEELISLIQKSADEGGLDANVVVYGSHATNLCLPWSDLDLVLVGKNNINSLHSYGSLRGLYDKLIVYKKL
jgi:DNA polymerase sigma